MTALYQNQEIQASRACGRYVKPLSTEQEAALARLKEEQAQVDEHMRHRKTDPVGIGAAQQQCWPVAGFWQEPLWLRSRRRALAPGRPDIWVCCHESGILVVGVMHLQHPCTRAAYAGPFCKGALGDVRTR